MSTLITIGRNGDQPFAIMQEGVSGAHARLTVDGDNWTLEDLNSTNGTYVRDEHGEMVRVGRCTVTPDTFIQLGPSTIDGCSFFARRLLGADDYRAEFNYLAELAAENRALIEKEEKRSHRRNLLTPMLYFIVILISFIPPEKYGVPPEHVSTVQMSILRIPMFLGGILSFLLAGNNRRKRLLKQWERLRRCPNPACHHTLTDGEVDVRQCARCKAH